MVEGYVFTQSSELYHLLSGASRLRGLVNYTAYFTMLIFIIFVSQKRVEKDITCFSYATTVGPAQFREQLLNRVQPKAQRGRPAKLEVAPGRSGPKPKAKTTRKDVKKAVKRFQGRTPLEKDDDEGLSDP